MDEAKLRELIADWRQSAMGFEACVRKIGIESEGALHSTGLAQGLRHAASRLEMALDAAKEREP